MGVFIVLVILCILNIIAIILDYGIDSDGLFYIGGAGLIAGVLAIVFLFIAFVSTPTYTEHMVTYNHLVSECESISEKLSKTDDKDSVYAKVPYHNIDKYNSEIKGAKEHGNSFWIGCFYNEELKDLPLIDIKDYLKE